MLKSWNLSGREIEALRKKIFILLPKASQTILRISRALILLFSFFFWYKYAMNIANKNPLNDAKP